ncbi:hypothetical protein [Liquorilactobacillus hordei]|uniref:hypothetical protein n=1 Tax=Liquorilactobacillus hordei TaxID=468911 RepID=UPI0039E9D64E
MDERFINFDSKSSLTDFNCVINEANVGLPEKSKTRIQIPNTSLYYDYANIFGDVYSERTLEYTFLICDVNALNTIELEHRKGMIANWLIPGSQHLLQDSAIPGYYFKAEVQSSPEYTDNTDYAFFKVSFICYPFRIRNFEEGKDTWDTFDFDNDVAQDTSFSISESQKIMLINTGSTVLSPGINVTGNLSITMNDETKTFTSGSYDDTGLVLERGENVVNLSGSGTVQFHFTKEVI